MSLVADYNTNRITSYGLIATTQSAVETVYTCPLNCKSLVQFINVCNENGSSTHYTVTWYESTSTNSYTLISAKNLAALSCDRVADLELALQPGDKIQVTPTNNATPELHVTITCAEQFIPVG